MSDKNIKEFVETWTGKGYEKGEAQSFWRSLLHEVLGIADLDKFIRFEDRVHIDHTSFIDAYIPSTKVLIEQKGLGKDLNRAIRQSDGSSLTPFQQAKRYSAELPYSQRPRWIVVCNFAEFHVYDMENPRGEPEKILLKDLAKESFRLRFLTDSNNCHIQKELEVSLKAGEIVGKIYDSLLAAYKDPESPATLHSLNILCVRLVFCLYAEDAGIFGTNTHSMFYDYLNKYASTNPRRALIDLFKVLDTKQEDRDPYLDEDLAAFPYVNGGLFADESILIPQISPETVQLILKRASADFDWSEISPTIFGAVFESTLNPETRRKGGMHYTSIENIHKVIDPLFMDDLREEFVDLKAAAVGAGGKTKAVHAKLLKFQEKLASLKFLDPACGSGNFLTETFISLRRLENDVVKVMTGGQSFIGLEEFNPIKVNIHQFYGIEINDFAATVAKTALWIAESQMIHETEDIIDCTIDFLPLKRYANIKVGNALRLDWGLFNSDESEAPRTLRSEEIKNEELRIKNEDSADDGSAQPSRQAAERVTYDYIMGNPPFAGRRYRTEEQIAEVAQFFDYRDIDYVACWYYKAAQLMQGARTRTALVSTNSITQGEQVSALWKPLAEKFSIHIDFAYTTFRWDSESIKKAAVHCVIIGFSAGQQHKQPRLFLDEKNVRQVSHLNGYLLEAPDIFIENRSKPLFDVPQMRNGNVPLDGDALKIEAEDIEQFSNCMQYVKRLIGGRELLHNELRYVLWLVDVDPSKIHANSKIYERVKLCRDNRLAMKDKATRRLAETPTVFRDTINPDYYIALPMVSSENRRYIPMAYFDGGTIPTNQVQIIPSATLYHFGVLTSSVHMAWMRAVCGRLEMRYRYSKDIVYNNFPWPAGVGSGQLSVASGQCSAVCGGKKTPMTNDQSPITKTAQAILDVRSKYPDSSLADLYDELTMPADLRKAHRENDKAVLDAYGFPHDISEPDLVARLMELYREMA